MTQDNPFISPEFAKMFEKMALPGFDLHSFVTLQQKNMEAFQLAQKTMMEGVQMVMKREVEIVQGSVEDAMKTMQELMAETDPKANVKMRVELARQGLEQALANLRELASLTQKSNEEAFAILNRRALESFDEMKAAMAKAGQG
jgi:phasin family protein